MLFSHRQYIRAQRQLARLHTIRRYNYTAEMVLAKYGVKALEESIQALEADIQRYHHWLNGITPINLSVLDNVAEQLIMARIYCGMTQEQLAEHVGTNRQQINRLERTLYQTASLKFIMSIKEILKARVAEIKEHTGPYEERRRQRYLEQLEQEKLQHEQQAKPLSVAVEGPLQNKANSALPAAANHIPLSACEYAYSKIRPATQ